MEIRRAAPEDLPAICRIEAICFPAAEAADPESLSARFATFPEQFFVAAQGENILGFINGMVTDEQTIRDEMFEKPELHNPRGSYQSIFGLDVLPEHQRKGIAADLMNALLAAARNEGRKGAILTCKDHLIHYYERFGFRNLGVSASVHGGAVWYDMLASWPSV